MGNIKDKIDTDCAIWFPEFIFGQKWNMSIILELINASHYTNNSMSYTDITSLIPDINSRTLSRRLTELEELGIIKVHQNKKTPKKVRYSLTQSGKELIPIITAMRKWSLKFGNCTNPTCRADQCRHFKEAVQFIEQEDLQVLVD